MTTQGLAEKLPPVLLFGGGLTLLGVMRRLSRAGIPFYVVGGGQGFPARSRFYRRLEANSPSPQPRNLAAFLEALSLPAAVLMPCADDWAQAVSQLPGHLQNRFLAVTPTSAAVHTMVNKWQFAELLCRLEIPRPHTELLSSPGEAEMLADPAFQGKILKPLSSVQFCSQHGVKGFLVNSRDEVLAALRKIDLPIMLQEYIPGPATNSFFLDGFVDRRGQLLACFARQRLRMHPDKLGNSTLMESIPLRRVRGALESMERIIAATDYRGIFSAEFKYDARDKLYKIIEINPRPWWYVEFAGRCGVDICELAYRDALGLPVAPVKDYAVGRRCLFSAADWRAYRNSRRAGTINAWSWLKSCIGAQDALLELADPIPFLAYIREIMKRRRARVGRGAPAPGLLPAAHRTRG